MGWRDYPKLGTTKVLDRKNQFGRKQREHSAQLCYCCDSVATHRIDIQNSYLRGEDDVMLVCTGDLELARQGKWRELYQRARAVGRWKET